MLYTNTDNIAVAEPHQPAANESSISENYVGVVASLAKSSVRSDVTTIVAAAVVVIVTATATGGT
jgi:hypothetical protein